MKRTLLLLILLCSAVIAFAQDATVIYKNTVNSTVTFETEDGLGSGFFVGENIIATNYHVIKGDTEAYCYSNNSDTKYKIDGYVAVDTSVDLILLKVSGLKRTPIRISATPVEIGQKVYVIGSPKGLPATISDGIVSALRDFDGYKLIQITAPISHGSSGGPVLNSKGELIGVSVGQLKEGQNLNFAIPKANLKLLINKKRTYPISLTELNNEYYKVPTAKAVNFGQPENKKVNVTVIDSSQITNKPIINGTSVIIGTQEWSNTNLNVTNFQNGDPIPEAESENEWNEAWLKNKPVWCYYNGDASNGNKYGKLYNWYAIHDSRGLAPYGWHIPSDEEWNTLLGSTQSGFYNEWLSKRNQAIRSGFAVLYSGSRGPSGPFEHIGEFGTFWSTSEDNNSSSYTHALIFSNTAVWQYNLNLKGNGFSVRCIKDN